MPNPRYRSSPASAVPQVQPKLFLEFSLSPLSATRPAAARLCSGLPLAPVPTNEKHSTVQTLTVSTRIVYISGKLCLPHLERLGRTFPQPASSARAPFRQEAPICQVRRLPGAENVREWTRVGGAAMRCQALPGIVLPTGIRIAKKG
jgi:hypothetical protein